jgi:hypothetical protein
MITEENQHLFDNNENDYNEQEQPQSELQSELESEQLQSEQLQSEQQSEQLQSELQSEQLQSELQSELEQEIEENIIEKIDNNEKKNNNIEIRELIEKWLYLDDEIHKINEELKDLKLEKKQYEFDLDKIIKMPPQNLEDQELTNEPTAEESLEALEKLDKAA